MKMSLFLRRIVAFATIAASFGSVVSAQIPLLAERFNDGSRTNLSAPASAAWFSSNTAATVFANGAGGANGTLAPDNSSSCTLVGYFAPVVAPATLPLGETMTLTIDFTVTGAPLTKSNSLILGLLQSIANPSAVTSAGAGFTAVGSPNTNARVDGDFGSSNPTSHVFSNYTGYAVWTNLNGTSSSLRKRNAANDGLDNASAAWTQIGSTGGTAGAGLAADTNYRATLTLNRTAGGSMNLSYTLTQGATTLLTLSVNEASASYTTFDTVNIYLASGTLTGAGAASLVLKQIDVSVTSASATIAPTIGTQPVNQSVIAGDTAAFSVVANGTAPFSYQWRKGGVTPVGTNSATLSLPNVQVGDAGSYDVVITNSFGTATSIAATLTVAATATPPSIVTPPVSQSVAQGGTASFTVSAAGSAPLLYQWRRNGTNVGAASASPTLTLANVQSAAAGDYDVIVTNSSPTAATSAIATLTVLLPPVIATPPAGQTAGIGESKTFTVSATGDGPFTYQWRRGGVVLGGATSASLVLTNIQPTDAASYEVVVTGPGGSTTSAAATLVVNTPPLIVAAPAGRPANIGGSTSFTVVASGSAPLVYQWKKDGADLPGETVATLTLTNLQAGNAGGYSVRVMNAFGSATSAVATLTVTPALPYSVFNLTGFGRATTGGGVIAETNGGYRKVVTPLEFVTALADKTGAVKVIEVMNDLDLGYIEAGAAVRALSIFREHATPKLHPRLIATGVSLIDIQSKSGLTIFSANGSTIRHTTLNIKSSDNVIVRNLKFDEMWEWDEATKGEYDSNDWDFIDLGNSGTVFNIWIDHCTFTKAYDGISDIKKGSYDITFSWNHYTGDDGATNSNSFVRQQIAALEANRAARPFYDFLRTNGFSVEDIVAILQGHDKTHLIGALSLNDENKDHTITFHHQWHVNPWDRLPRLRAGNVHNYNIFVDDRLGRQAKLLRDTRANAMTTSARNTLNNTYNFNVFLNGSISTEGGAVLVEKSVYLDCLTPLRNNQTDPSNPIYSGKILALDTICRMTDNAGVSTTVRGNSTDAGNPMGPFQAPVIPFGWNLSGNVLPYTAPMDDPTTLEPLVQAGAGAGKVSWSKDNWLKTSYAASAPVVVVPPASQSVGAGGAATLSVVAAGVPTPTYQWKRNGAVIAGATGGSLTLASVAASDAGLYTVDVTSNGSVTSEPAVLGVATTSKVVGAGTEVGANILHPSGNTYDQILLQGAAATISADAGQVTRISYIDLTDDIVQVEFAGAGSLSLVLDNPSGPAVPLNYNQPTVSYMKGHATVVIVGANETTNVSVFSVGRINAVNQALFKDNVTYDGLADIASLAIQSANGKFGGIRTANTSYFATRGTTGVYAPGVQFSGPVFVGDINASDTATPVMILGSAADTRITGGDLMQANAGPVKISGLTQLKFVAGSTSHGTLLLAQTIKGRLQANGIDVTDQIVVYEVP